LLEDIGYFKGRLNQWTHRTTPLKSCELKLKRSSIYPYWIFWTASVACVSFYEGAFESSDELTPNLEIQKVGLLFQSLKLPVERHSHLRSGTSLDQALSIVQ
jgi:hypothetical protein